MSHFDDTFDKDATIPDDFQLRELTPGLTLCGKYRLEKEAGAGGMGVVWKAWDVVGERWVALKFIPPEIRHSEGAMVHVKTAFQTVQALNHQNIGPVYSLEKDGTFGCFIVKKWLEGQTLDKIKLPPERIPDVLAKVAAALDYAHSKRVMHRDVKPSNIFIGTDGDVFLIDFDIAAEIHNSISQNADPTAGRTSGTRPYMAPEQWRGQHQDGQTDQYALGVVAYQLYSGSLPFQIKDPVLLRMAVLQDPPEPLQNVPPNMNAAILRALSKNRKDRFATCREFIDALSGATFYTYSTTPPVYEDINAQFAGAKAEMEARLHDAKEKLRQSSREFNQKIHYEYQTGDSSGATTYSGMSFHLNTEDPNSQWVCEEITPKFEIHVNQGERKERKHKAKEKAERLNRERNEKVIFFCIILFLFILPIMIVLKNLWHEAQDQKRVEQAIQLQKNTAPNGNTRLVKTVDGVDYAFRWCPPGEFMMGGKRVEWYALTSKHKNDYFRVKLTKGFWLLETEVTQKMWQSVMGESIESKTHRGKITYALYGAGWDCPMYYITWTECQEFCRKLSEKLGQTVELPTEAQWEYACRAGTKGDYAGNLKLMGWYDENSGSTTHAVGMKKPNPWGLYDMHGNVAEWCSDYYYEYDFMPQMIDPEGPTYRSSRVSRGGSWDSYAEKCQSASRDGAPPSFENSHQGFRILLVPDQED